MTALSEPLLFRRHLQTAVWGGGALIERLGVDNPPSDPVGETWELSDYPGRTTVVRGGAFDGWELQALLAEHGDDLLGESRRDPEGCFPLLVKFIEARKDLSGYVLPDSTPEAAVIAGLRPESDPASFARDAASPAVLNHLRELPVHGGDCLLIEAGTPHAIRAGTMLVEVQQTSDVTFRMYDWGRMGLDGQPRETHVEQALAVVDHDAAPPELVRAAYPPAAEVPVARVASLVSCPWFRLHDVRLQDAADHDPEGFARILVVLGGDGTVAGPHGDPRALVFGDTVMLPAHMGPASFTPGPDGLHLLEAVAL
jgi:mannose-6-phosphate isomerase